MSVDRTPFWLLNGQAGWRTAAGTEASARVSVSASAGIRLAADPNGAQAFSTAVADLGGLVLPRRMAVDDRGRLYLAGRDEQGAWIKRFDSLTQQFITLPLIDPREQGERRFTDPISIAYVGRQLYVVDGASGRVLVFDLATLVLRHVWRSPNDGGPEPALQPWRPWDVVAYGPAAYILDQHNGQIWRHQAGTEALTPCLAAHQDAPPVWQRLAIDRTGAFYLLDLRQNKLDIAPLGQASTARKVTTSVSTAGDVQANFDPTGVLVDNSAPQAGATWRFGLPAQLVTDLKFTTDDLSNAVSLAQSLQNATDALSQYLYARLTPALKQLFTELLKKDDAAQSLTSLLVEQLNQQLQSSQLYTAARFAHVALSPELRKLAGQRLKDQERRYVNRLLLEQAYPQAIKPGYLVVYGPQIPLTKRPTGSSVRPCLTSIPRGLIFDPQGQPITTLTPDDLRDLPVYQRNGQWISQPLDSEIYQCQWHRLELTLRDLPDGTQVTVSTYTSERQLLAAEVDQLPAEFWDISYTFTGEPQHEKNLTTDCLVQSRQGRYLWLRLDLRGDGYRTPTVDAVRITYPRSSYLEYLPAVLASDDDSRWLLERLLAIMQTEWEALDSKIDTLYRFFDPDLVPDTHLAYLAAWLALPLEGEWTPVQKRRLLAAAPRFSAQRGSLQSLHTYLQLYLQNMTDLVFAAGQGSDDDKAGNPGSSLQPVSAQEKTNAESWCNYPLIVEGFRERSFFMLAQDRIANLGHGAPLWGPGVVQRLQLDVFAQAGEVRLVSTRDPERDLFHHYAHRFRVFVPAAWVRTATDELLLRRALDAEKPAHTQYDLCLVEANLRVGLQSTVGLDTIIGAYPLARLTRPTAAQTQTQPGAAAPRYQLGYDTVLSGQTTTGAEIRVTPQTRIGLQTRVA